METKTITEVAKDLGCLKTHVYKWLHKDKLNWHSQEQKLVRVDETYAAHKAHLIAFRERRRISMEFPFVTPKQAETLRLLKEQAEKAEHTIEYGVKDHMVQVCVAGLTFTIKRRGTLFVGGL